MEFSFNYSSENQKSQKFAGGKEGLPVGLIFKKWHIFMIHEKPLSYRHVVGSSFLVAGTSTGAGMLALPIVTSLGGFWPALVVYTVCWAFMSVTGLLLMEVCLRLPKDKNLVSMAGYFLGSKGKVFAWILYLFLFYSLSVAYISEGAELISELSNHFITPFWGAWIFTVVLGAFIFRGSLLVDRLNLFLMTGLIISYITFIFWGFEYVSLKQLKSYDWPLASLALPVIFTSFSYQGMVPSLTTYLQRDARRLRIAILSGTTITLIIYVIWEILILGIVPLKGPYGLMAARLNGEVAIEPLRYFTRIPAIYTIGRFFAFFAITTSFLGVNLGLFDFLADGLRMKKRGIKKWLIAFATFLPPLIISLLNPGIFLIALSYAGGVGCAWLLGFLPTLMVWIGRYVKKTEPLTPQVSGGRFVLSLLFTFVVLELLIEGVSEYLRLSGYLPLSDY